MATGQWADLPSELISLIAERLGVIDLFSFSIVCKGWNSAASTPSSQISAQIISSPNRALWFLLYGKNSQCFLVSETDKKYKISIPEMNGAACIASKEGWLLLHRDDSLFFFCPFSASKIDLPKFRKSEQCNVVATFSAPPTSEDCIVAVACQNAPGVDLHLLSRGAKEWTTHTCTHLNGLIKTITGAAYADNTFQFYDDKDRLLTFTPENGKWKNYKIIFGSGEDHPNTETVPFFLWRDSFKRCSMNERLGLGEDVSVSTCGTVVPDGRHGKILFNESVSQQSKSRGLRGVWIEPRSPQIPPEMSCKKVPISIALLAERCSRGLSTESRKLEEKVALITGAASGIGKATAAKFIGNGAKVVIADIQHQLGQQTAKELGPNATFIACDVTKESDVSDAVDFTISKHNQLDIMYNNAGVACKTPRSIVDLNLEVFDQVMRINVRGVVAGIKHSTRVMIPRRSGCILCTASVTGLLGGLAQHTYSVSKSAIIGLVKSMAAELCEYGIRINCISPFAIPTPFVMEEMSQIYAGVDAPRLLELVYSTGVLEGTHCEPNDIANAALYLASDDAKYVSGHNLVVDGGFTSFKNLKLPAPVQVL
ncbi:hypothetical protein WN944_016965 [Citrus x changshan-huyou]|uniref:(21S)-21-acetoxyl-apo-melianone synthase SDR n=1 Tax=Citrus x changshan-huyou TaxID=2935761 RepID=A0AAP0MAD0_9ROSI